MTTKKQMRARVAEKREKFMAEEKRRGLKALADSKVYEQAKREERERKQEERKMRDFITNNEEK